MLCSGSRSGDVKPNDALCGRCADSARCGNSRIRSVVKYVSSISTVYGAETSTYPGTECQHCTGRYDIEGASGTVLLVAKDGRVPQRVLHDPSKALHYRARPYVDTGTRNRESGTVRLKLRTGICAFWQAGGGSCAYAHEWSDLKGTHQMRSYKLV